MRSNATGTAWWRLRRINQAKYFRICNRLCDREKKKKKIKDYQFTSGA